MMIDLKNFTIDELLSIYFADGAENEEPREMTDKEQAAYNIATEIAADYLKRIKEKRLIELPIPLYSIVYTVTEERAFDWGSGKEPKCENAMECDPECEFNGKECKIMPFIEQKIYVPNSIWFDYITDNWGTKVFGTLKEAVKYINDKFGIEFCAENGLPTIDESGKIIIPGIDPDSEFMQAYAGETFGNPVIPKMDSESTDPVEEPVNE